MTGPRIYVWPADRYGCGMFRLAWPAQALAAAGADVTVTFPDERWDIGAKINKASGEVIDAVGPADADIHIIQRATHRYLVDAIPFWQAQGRRVVLDIDDDLSCIHPANPAWAGLHPAPENPHSWNNLVRAARMADVVTVTTPALATRYRTDAVVLPNYLPAGYYTPPTDPAPERPDGPLTICWPASIASHPNDAAPLANTLPRVLRETGTRLACLGAATSAPAYVRGFNLPTDPLMWPFADIDAWPALLARIDIGIAPLADTVFNRSKSCLKPLELSAAGVPWVASPRADYTAFHAATGVGTLADRPSAWRAALKRLATDEVWRKEQAAAGLEAAAGWRIEQHAWRWLEAWLG